MTTTRAVPGGSALHLTTAEGDAFRLVEVLVGHGRAAGLPPTIELKSPGPALVEAVARTVTAASAQLLLDNGGGRERVVLRGGRRRSGRLWDPALNEHFDLRCTRAALHFWLAAAKDLVPLAHRKRNPSAAEHAQVTRDDRRVARAMAPDGFDGAGDLVFFALVHQHLDALGLPPALTEEVRHSLRTAIPLALLLGADDPGIDDRAARGLLHTLTAPGPLRVMECIDDVLVAQWVKRFSHILLFSADRTEHLARMKALSRTLRTWLELLDGAERLDLTRAVARFLVSIPGRAMASGFDVRNHCLRLPGTSSMVERDENLAAIGGIVDLRLFLDEVRHRVGSSRYGDERYEEGQILLGMLDAELEPHRAPLDALARTLSGAVG